MLNFIPLSTYMYGNLGYKRRNPLRHVASAVTHDQWDSGQHMEQKLPRGEWGTVNLNSVVLRTALHRSSFNTLF